MSTFTGYTVKKIPFILADILARKFLEALRRTGR